MTLSGTEFSCKSSCFNNLSGYVLEDLLWREMGKVLAQNSIRSLVRKRLKRKVPSSQIRHLFEDLKGFVEFLPSEEKLDFANALIEKVEVFSADSVKIHFRL